MHAETAMPEDDYSFEPFFDRLEVDWYADDPLLPRVVEEFAAEGSGSHPKAELRRWAGVCSGRLRALAEESARPENRPRLEAFDARGNRVDRVRLPRSTRDALSIVEGEEGLGAVRGDPFVHYAKVYLCSQNGEAGVACSVACTDGLVRVLEAVGDRPEHARALEAVRGSGPERVVHGAQFVTEIQGGSDVPANRTRAVPDGAAFRLHGRKWFCSNVNADWYLVTARPEGAPDGARGVGLFLVPARVDALERASGGDTADRTAETISAGSAAGSGRPADRPLAPRNGHTVDRLKEKLGTRELATAELTFQGAVGWPVGPPERGLATLLRHVLVPSRFGCVVFAAAVLRRARRIAGAYAEFRHAFGRPIAEYPRVDRARRAIGADADRALAATFRLLALWEEARGREAWGEPGGRPEEEHAGAADFRVMLSLCKARLTRRATRRLHDAMMVLGGNGIEESFSPLPRLHRDAVIMETWEGPHDVLLSQALRDLERFDTRPEPFVERVAGPDRGALASRLREVLSGETDRPPTVAFGPVADELVDAFADRTLAEVGHAAGGGT